MIPEAQLWEGHTEVDAPRVCQVGAQGLQGCLRSKHQPVLKMPLKRRWCTEQQLITSLTGLTLAAAPPPCYVHEYILTLVPEHGEICVHAVP